MRISVSTAEIRNAADIERVLSEFGQQGGGLIVTPSALTATRRDLIISLEPASVCRRSIRSAFMPRVAVVLLRPGQTQSHPRKHTAQSEKNKQDEPFR
jgi:hypothetical protein